MLKSFTAKIVTGFEEIGQLFADMRNMQDLSLSELGLIGIIQSNILAEAPMAFPELTSLRLESDFHHQPMFRLRNLTEDNNITDLHMEQVLIAENFCPLVAKFSNLRKLKLDFVEMGQAPGISDCTCNENPEEKHFSITDLSIHCSHLNHECLDFVVKSNRGLKKIFLNTFISNQTVALAINTSANTIQKISLMFENTPFQGIESTEVLTNLEELHMEKNKIGEEGLSRMQYPNLRKLSLIRCTVSWQ